jgi:8-oxo-dGTP pyrophosphatase MutT (NUDIX family)
MVASAFLPVAWHKGTMYFLFGKERDEDSSPGFSDFGGGVENKEDIYEAGLREMAEETTGFFGDSDEIRAYVDSHGGVYPMVHEKYHIHIFRCEYEPKLIDYYNRSHTFIYDHMDHDYLKETKIFEKVEIRWVCVDDITKMRPQFRSYFQNIVDMIVNEKVAIQNFIRSRLKKRTVKKTLKTRKNR